MGIFRLYRIEEEKIKVRRLFSLVLIKEGFVSGKMGLRSRGLGRRGLIAEFFLIKEEAYVINRVVSFWWYFFFIKTSKNFVFSI